MKKFVCEVCGRGPCDDVSLFRTGEQGPGKDPHWRCTNDLTTDQRKEIPQEVVEVVGVIEADGKTLH